MWPWGTDTSEILNQQDWANYEHDLQHVPTAANNELQWVVNSWRGNGAYLTTGPIGFAYRVLGTVGFGGAGLIEKAFGVGK